MPSATSPQSAEILVTKIAAARRLLRAAVRMHFSREDELAVHAVASAAYSVLRELKDKRGQNEAEYVMQTETLGYLALAKRRTESSLPPEILADEYTVGFLDELIENLNITPQTDISEISLSVTLDSSSTASFWRTHNRTFNFLKHADRDSDALLSLADVDNLGLLMRGMLSYDSIAPDDLGFEGLVLKVYFRATRTGKSEPDDPLAALVSKLRTMTDDEKFEYSAYQLNRPRPAGLG